MAKNFNSSALPEHCYAVLPGSGQLIEVRRGEKGYYPCAYSTSDREPYTYHKTVHPSQSYKLLPILVFPVPHRGKHARIHYR